jgi:hypothetical protein
MTNDLIKKTPLSDIHISSEQMYEEIAATMDALSSTKVDGYTKQPLPVSLQAYNTKKYLPDTEIEMLHSSALPMSDVDIKEFQEIQKRTNSLQFRVKQLQSPARTLAEITGSRVRIAYRLTKYMTHIRGIGGIGQPVIFSTASANAQINLLELPMPFNPAVGWYRGLTAVRNLLAEETENRRQYTFLINGEVYKTTGLSILPPPLHDEYFPQDNTPPYEYRRSNYSPPSYNPLSDGPLNTYLNICEFLVRHLSIGEEDVDEQAAVIALLNPKIARLAWPCRDDIENFEEYVLLPYVNKIVVECSRIKAIDRVKKELKLTQAEAFDFVETAVTYSEQAFTYDANRERSTMLNKLHHLAEDCDEAAMKTTQLNSYKTILQVLGLTKHEEDSNLDRREVLSSALEADTVAKLPAISTEDEIT